MEPFPDPPLCWADLAAPDPDAAARFYCDLFDWELSHPSASGYRRFLQDGVAVAGLTAGPETGRANGWLVYFAVADIDDLARRVLEAGGDQAGAMTGVDDLGRRAVFTDPTSAAFGVMQLDQFPAPRYSDQPVSLRSSDLMSRDPSAAGRFYARVFGWSLTAPPYEMPGDYRSWSTPGGTLVGGLMPLGDDLFGPGHPSRWDASFAVADTDAIVDRAVSLGATVTLEAGDIPVGRYADFADPGGVWFSVMQTA